MSGISEIQLAQFKTKLLDAIALIRTDIAEELKKSTHEYQLQNMCNDQLLELLSELNLPLLSAKADKIKKIDATLNNISIGMFGLCSDCEEQIESKRLNEDATTQRCLCCESRYNKQKCNHYKL